MAYTGVIIEESINNPDVLSECTIVDTSVERVTEKHQTPSLKQWTLHTVEIDDEKAEAVARLLAKELKSDPSCWYADFKNDDIHFIVYPHEVFRIDRRDLRQYEEASAYGISLGIPDYQVDFAPNVVDWQR